MTCQSVGCKAEHADRNKPMSKRIAIVGGGYLGTQLATSLEEAADVTLIEQHDHFVHASAMIRAMVEPSILDRALIPYNVPKNGRFVLARASGVDEAGVSLECGGRVDADYVVVATGSSNTTPLKPAGGGIEGLREANARVHAQLKAASTVAIVGAGAVGTELAGEISHFMPDKKVVLISDQPRLFPGMPDRLGIQLAEKLRALGVELIFGARAESLESTSEPYSGTLKLTNGRDISADLIFPAVGSRASPHLLENLPGATKGSGNRIVVDRWMRPSSHANIFAAGDVAEMGDGMTIIGVSRQQPWLTKALTALVAGKSVETLKPYAPWPKPPIMVPLGPHKGNAFLGLWTAGDFLTRRIKGKDLFLPRYRKLLGHP